MKIYFAPLEGITGYIYRNAFHQNFGSADKYFTPFLSPGEKKKLSTKEKNDILPAHNEGMYAVPQLMSKNAQDVVRACEVLRDYGYEEVNINIGCPSGTVVNKGRGAGMLANLENLNSFLDEVFTNTDMSISIKTRIGMERMEEWQEILKVYNQYSLKELIVHPRLRKDFYNGTPSYEAFGYAMQQSKNPLCYNGDINTLQDYMQIKERFSNLEQVMIGRGFLRNPFLLQQLQNYEKQWNTGVANYEERQEIQDEKVNGSMQPIQIEQLRNFHTMLLQGYKDCMSGETPVLFKMKELWFYMQNLFPQDEKLYKKIRKAKSLSEYESIVKNALLKR